MSPRSAAAGSVPELGHAPRLQRDPFRRAGLVIPSLGRSSLALDAAGASSAVESRLGALVLCAAAILSPSDPESGSISIRPLALAHRLATDVPAVHGILGLLDRAGLLHLGAGPEVSGGDEIAVTADWQRVAAPPVVGVVNWPVLLERLAGHPASLAVALAFAEATVAPGEQTPITVPQLVEASRYSDRTVKGALAHLVDERVLVRGPRIGARSRYAFSEAALGLIPFPDDADVLAATTAPSSDAAMAAELSALRTQVEAIRELLVARSPERPAAPASSSGDGLTPSVTDRASDAPTAYLELHGTRIALPPGATLHLETDASGQLWYRMGGVRFGPIVP